LRITLRIDEEQLDNINMGNLNFSILPKELHELIPLLNEWAISDDSEREKKIDAMSQAQKDMLITTVNPKFPIINSYLDTFNAKAMPEEATIVGSLAELVCEIM